MARLLTRRAVVRGGLAGGLLGLVSASSSGCATPAIVVITGGGDVERAAAYQRMVTTAIPAVEELWGSDAVPLPVRLELPATLTAWSALTGHEPDQQGYAASTVRSTAGTDGPLASGSGSGSGSGSASDKDDAGDDVKIVMHPDAWVELNPEGRLGVMVHEITHLAMGTGEGAPWWLGEGLAEYTAHRTSARTLEQIAGSAWAPLVANPPTSWPTPDPEQPWNGYARAWLACVFLAEMAGEDSLVVLYERVTAGATLDRALRATVGRDEADLLKEWSLWLSAA